MVIFDRLQVSADGSKLFIDMHINTAEYFDNVYLDSITIKTSDEVKKNPDNYSSGYIYKRVFAGNQKAVNLVLTKGDFDEAFTASISNLTKLNQETDIISADTNFTGSLGDKLFFVYVDAKGEPDECTPCELQANPTVGVTFDTTAFHQKVMDYTKELAADCTIPQGFTDFILLWNAFKSSVDTGHYNAAIKYYNLLFDKGRIGNVSVTSGCGCHG